LTIACLDDGERAALDSYRMVRGQVTELTETYLTAASRGDTSVMLELAADSVRGHLPFAASDRSPDVLAAARGIRDQYFELGPGIGTFGFSFDQNGEQRQGIADVVFEAGHWRISRLSLLVEY
jgi:hypothetical protein